MRTYLLLATALCVLIPSAAHACSCVTDDGGALANEIMNDPSVSVAKVLVRGVNPAIGQSMLELKETVSGGLTARDFRAKFATHTCGVIPQAGKVQTLLIKFEQDGTYSVLGKCKHNAVITHLQGKN